MTEGGSYIAYCIIQLCASPDSRRRRQLNIRLKHREVVVLKTSDVTPSRGDEEMNAISVLKLCDKGFAEEIEDMETPELFKSFDLSPHAYLQQFEFYKALSNMGLGGKTYSDLRNQLVKKFEAFADSLDGSHGVTRTCSFTAHLYVIKVDLVFSVDSVSDHIDEVLEEDTTSIIRRSLNSGLGLEF